LEKKSRSTLKPFSFWKEKGLRIQKENLLAKNCRFWEEEYIL